MDQIEAVFGEKVRLKACVFDQKWVVTKFDDFSMKMRVTKSRQFLLLCHVIYSYIDILPKHRPVKILFFLRRVHWHSVLKPLMSDH